MRRSSGKLVRCGLKRNVRVVFAVAGSVLILEWDDANERVRDLSAKRNVGVEPRQTGDDATRGM